MSLFPFLLRTSRGGVILAVVAGVVGGVSSVAVLGLIPAALGGTTVSKTALAWAFAGLCLLTLAARVVSQTALVHVSQRAVTDLCLRLSRRIVAAPLRHVEELGSHRLLATLTNDVAMLVHALNALPALFINLIIVLCCLVYLGWLSLAVLGATVLFVVAGVVSYRLCLRPALRYLHQARAEQDALMGHFRGLTEGIKELKIHRGRREDFLARSLQSTLDALERHGTVGMSLFTFAANWGRLLSFLLIGFLLFVLPHVREVDPRVLSGYAFAILFALSSVESIVAFMPVMGRARVALDKVEELGLSLAADEEKEEGAAAAPSGWRALELKGVTHTYWRERERRGFMLGPVDLTFRPGELVFIVGGNGSGKTTLAKLLLGLYVPEAGAVCLDGRPVTHEDREGYRQLFAAVFADFYLFDGFPGLDVHALDERAREYLALLELDHVVGVKDGRLTTTALSTGQRKRLALLTAYLEDRPVYVFDEWAADQDPEFKRVFYTRLLPELKDRGKLVVAISHDEHYFHHADRVVRIVEGKVGELARRRSEGETNALASASG